MIQRIKTTLRGTNQAYLFHDSREDIRTLIKVINILADKINELVDEANKREAEK